MKVADFLVDCLIENGTTDVFGLPGEVVLELLDAFDKRKNDICAHLCYHEQAGALAACGYAQASGRLGVAYATNGPGIMNMMSAIQDAYCDSTPVVFITAHKSAIYDGDMRFKDNQEINTSRIFFSMTKRVIRVDNLDTATDDIKMAIEVAQSGRHGPVLLDFSSKILSAEVPREDKVTRRNPEESNIHNCEIITEYILTELRTAKRPVILFGDGIRQSGTEELARLLLERMQVPALTSRFSQNIVGGSELNFGYIGSHATRYSNIILAKCDLIVSLGNRMAFKPDSATFGEIARNTRIIRIDIDEFEFTRDFSQMEGYKLDLSSLIPLLAEFARPAEKHQKWLSICKSIRSILIDYDTGDPVCAIATIMRKFKTGAVFTSDVGNNEFWVSRAYTLSKVFNRILYSKSFGLLGCSLPKAIGAQLATSSEVICFTGDQGFQINMQELQFVATNNLPILIVVINNNSSGMILSKQRERNSTHFLHTTNFGGYSMPSLKGVADAYGIGYCRKNCENIKEIEEIIAGLSLPCILELIVPETAEISPNIPLGNRCDEFMPPTKDAAKRQIEELFLSEL